MRALILFIAILSGGPAAAERSWHLLALEDPLDHADGYCLDVPGVGEHAMLWKPLIAHNCKAGFWGDEAVEWRENGQIHFPAYDRCVVAMGIKYASLPGASLLLHECDGENALQRFKMRDDGRIEQADSGLCVVVGDQSSSTWRESDRWRVLSLETCADSDPKRSSWRILARSEDW